MRDCWGDGILIYGGPDSPRSPSENVTLDNVTCDNNRRNGLAIANVRGCRVLGGLYKNTNGTSPEAGIDVEPDGGEDFIENVVISGVRTEGNHSAGILVVPGQMAAAPNKSFSG